MKVLLHRDDEFKVYFDGTNIRGIGIHHDGTNHYLYREFKDNVNKEIFLEKLYNQEIEYEDLQAIGRYTRPLKQVMEIFGW